VVKYPTRIHKEPDST